MPIVLSGLGLISPLGTGAWPTFSALLAGATLTQRARPLPNDLAPVDLVRAVGCVQVAGHSSVDPALELMQRASLEALTEANGSSLGMGQGATSGATSRLCPKIQGRTGVSPVVGRHGRSDDPTQCFPAEPNITSGSFLEASEADEASGVSGASGASGGGAVPCFLGSSKGAVTALTGAWAAGLPREQQRQVGISGAIPEDAHLAGCLGPCGYLAYHLQRRLAGWHGAQEPEGKPGEPGDMSGDKPSGAPRSTPEPEPGGTPWAWAGMGIRVMCHRVGACASSLMAVHDAADWLKRTGQPVAMVASSEAALLPTFIHGYHKLGVLAPLGAADYASRPMDRRRNGFMLSEMGAAVVLRQVDQLRPGDIELVDTAVATDPSDLIRPSGDMAGLHHVAQQLLSHQPMDMIHPHATGTHEHDPAELAVYARTASRPWPDVYALKGAIGHGLGCSGLASLVVACLCAKTQRRPAMPWLDQPMDAAIALKKEAQTLPGQSRHAIFAAGFGGHVAGAVIRKLPRHA